MKNKTIQYIKSDLFRYQGNTSLKSFLLMFFGSSTFRWQIRFRFFQQMNIRLTNGLIAVGGGKSLIVKLLWFFCKQKEYDLFPFQKVGYGLYIAHHGKVVVNTSATLGNNCSLHQGVTITGNVIIGNNVWVGPNVVVLNNVKIGNNVTIGAGAIVTKDVPDNATIAGNPAKVLHYNESKITYHVYKE